MTGFPRSSAELIKNTSVISPTTLPTVKDALDSLYTVSPGTVLTTLGDLLSYNSGPVRVAVGAADTFLGSTGAAVPSWRTAAQVKTSLGLATSTTDNAAVRFDGTGGNTQNSLLIIDDSGYISSFGGQITFPATQAASAGANTLDDYEEGTWTPAVTFGGGSTGVTYASQSGVYTKIGRLVYVEGGMTLTSKGSSTGAALWTGLPFACGGASHAGSTRINAMTAGVGDTYLMPFAIASSTTIRIDKVSGGSAAQLTDADYSGTSSIIISVTYSV